MTRMPVSTSGEVDWSTCAAATVTRSDTLDASWATSYAEAICAPRTAPRGPEVPATIVAVPLVQCTGTLLEQLLPEEISAVAVASALDLRFERSVAIGATLRTTAAPYALRRQRSSALLTVRALTHDGEGEVIAETFMTVLLRGLELTEDHGREVDGHRIPDDARSTVVSEVTSATRHDQPALYAKAAREPGQTIHTDEDLARAAGLRGVILQGACTLAITGTAVFEAVASDGSARWRRLAGRFAAPVFAGDDLISTIHPIAPTGPVRAYGFSVTSGGQTVLGNGRVEVTDA